MLELEVYLNNVENGFIVSTESNDFIWEAKLSPAFSDDQDPQFDIQLRIKRKDGGQVLDFGNIDQGQVLIREGHLSFELLKDVSLDINGKTESPVFHHYERNYGLKPSVDLMFRFKHLNPEQTVELNYRDELFGQGLIKLEFSKELFNKCHVEKT